MWRILKWSLFLIFSGLFILGISIAWKLYPVQQPFQKSDIPQWEVHELSPKQWKLNSVEDPQRTTNAWFEAATQKTRCDTVILLGGVEEGANLLSGRSKQSSKANVLVLEHPIQSFLERNPWKQWTLQDWWNIPERAKEEVNHTLGALNALVSYTHRAEHEDPRFSNQVLLAGGSFGAPFPTILTSFDSERIAALSIIYGFTNFQTVIYRELYRQGLIHFKLTPPSSNSSSVLYSVRVFAVKSLAQGLAFLLSNTVKYGQMELYLPQIHDTPIYFISGKHDSLVPSEAYQPLWDAAPQPKTEAWVEGGHINPADPKGLRYVMEKVQKWSSQQGLWRCHDEP